MNKLAKSIAAALFATACAGQAMAAMEPASFPQETRLVRFVFDANRTFDILTRPNAITDLSLPPGETLTAFALGDTVQWVYDQAPGHIFIKPSREDLFTSATIVTNKRSYQLQLRSMPADGNWYQRVSWEYPELVVARQQQAAEEAKLEAGDIPSPEKLRFGYKIKGDAAFAPTMVFDDGTFVWMKLPADTQETPAVFMREKNKLVLVNYTVRGDYILVQRLAEQLVLKTGKSEVQVIRQGGRDTGNSRTRFDW